jgi:membrane protease YdiL (CAAX protease family)
MPKSLLAQDTSVAGALSIVALVWSWVVLIQLVKLPARLFANFSGYPLLTVTLVWVMASLVSSLTEEVGFRGYFQGILEHKLSGPLSIIIAALLIAPAHGLTQGFVWPLLLWYLFVDVMFGAMAYFTQSILPGIVVHSLGLLIFFTLVWPYDAQRRLVWQTGPNIGFWLTVAQVVVFSVLAILAFNQLARVTKGRRSGAREPLLPPSTDESVG